MLVIPAIDLSQGQVVRLAQGDMARKTVYGSDPAVVAASFAEAGARMIHVVDLDGAFAGEPRNEGAIGAVCQSAGVPVEVGGGVRSLGAIEHKLELGAARVVIGTAGVREPGFVGEAIKRFGSEAIVGALDVRDCGVAVAGWVESVGSPAEIGRAWRDAGLEVALHTDVSRDGIGGGPNLESSIALARGTGLRIIVSGGVSVQEHVWRVLACGEPLIDGLIIGRALYEGTVDLAEACRAARTEEHRC